MLRVGATGTNNNKAENGKTYTIETSLNIILVMK
jgi:hypothetical protein